MQSSPVPRMRREWKSCWASLRSITPTVFWLTSLLIAKTLHVMLTVSVRRQTKDTIFPPFISLLNQKLYSNILLAFNWCFSSFNVRTDHLPSCSSTDSVSADLRWGPRFCIFKELSGENAASLRSTLWTASLWSVILFRKGGTWWF